MLLTDGKSTVRNSAVLPQMSGISQRPPRLISTLLMHARNLRQDCTISRQEFLAEAIVGLRSIRQQAERRGQYQVAVNTVRLMTELVGLDK